MRSVAITNDGKRSRNTAANVASTNGTPPLTKAPATGVLIAGAVRARIRLFGDPGWRAMLHTATAAVANAASPAKTVNHGVRRACTKRGNAA